MKSDETREQRIARARQALADRYAADPAGVDAFQLRMQRIARAGKRERDRFEQLVLAAGDPRPSAPAFIRPMGMSSRDWKAERKRIQRAYEDALIAWNAARRKAGATAPTPQQLEKAPYVESEVCDRINGRKVKIGRAFCRLPRFETFDWLSVDQIGALRRYRRAFDLSELSPTKSGLDIGEGGGGSGSESAIARVQALAFADIAVQRLEATVPAHLLRTLRAVALHDEDFTALALTRFGSASGQRRTRVRQEFTRATDALVAATAAPAPASVERVAQPLPAPSGVTVDPAFLDERGIMRPMGEIVDLILNRINADLGEAA